MNNTKITAIGVEYTEIPYSAPTQILSIEIEYSPILGMDGQKIRQYNNK